MPLLSDRVLVIAEAGVNHNGSLAVALQLVDEAVDAGADVIKFQSFKAENLVSRHAVKADYQKRTTGADDNQLEMLKRLELTDADHYRLQKRCDDKGIQFLSAPFDHQSLDLLVHGLNLPLLKFGSGELTNAPLLLAAAQSGRKIILSTGMANLDQVRDALGVLACGYLAVDASPCREGFRDAFDSEEGLAMLRSRVTLLHCTTEYPAPFDEVNLRAIDTLRETFGLSVGYSDHTLGWSVPWAAVARGAEVIEKHFTLDRTLPGPDHQSSLEPDELKEMIAGIRQIEAALGDGNKLPTPSEAANMAVARKSLVTAMAVGKGERFTKENLTVKRPGHGVYPFFYWDYLGQRAQRDYAADELV